jgi:hypothetical protein
MTGTMAILIVVALIAIVVAMWRIKRPSALWSLACRLNPGAQGVAGSNPVIPTNFYP